MQTQKGSVLGKGLASLLPGAVQPQINQMNSAEQVSVQPPAHQNQRHLGISMAMVEEIKINPYQPRREFDEKALSELSQSIQANGIIQPLLVRKTETGFELIAGERRLRAAKLAGLKQVPVVIRRSTDKESLELAILENIQRENLSCVEEAQAYFRLLNEFALTQEQIAEKLGKERATVANHLRILKLPETILEDLKKQKLSFGHAKVILSLDDHDERMNLRNRILFENLSVRKAEEAVQETKAQITEVPQNESHLIQSAEAKQLTAVAERLKNLALDLCRQLSLRVEIKGNSRRGKIIVHYSRPEELERIIQALQNHKS
ncbi:MAG: ParB/RepB/Spo0J family partition protein [Xanthomonadaceae bacterium]|nr:ParB/RepB/Spo0J family partition protein [Xanthomonadaceae bacterium]